DQVQQVRRDQPVRQKRQREGAPRQRKIRRDEGEDQRRDGARGDRSAEKQRLDHRGGAENQRQQQERQRRNEVARADGPSSVPVRIAGVKEEQRRRHRHQRPELPRGQRAPRSRKRSYSNKYYR